MGHIWPTFQLVITLSWYRKLHLVTRDGKLGLHASHYLAISLISFSYMFKEVSTVFGIHTAPQMSLIFCCLSLYVLPNLFFPFPSPFDPLVFNSPPLHRFPFLGRSISPLPVPCCMPNLCDSVGYRLVIIDLNN